jgi:capsular polysaccharide transport system permease protein
LTDEKQLEVLRVDTGEKRDMTTTITPPLPQTSAQREMVPRPKQTAQQRRRRRLLLSAILFVLLPSFAATAYYTLIAAPQYAVEVRFAVRGIDSAGAGSELLGMFTGVAAPGSTLTDAYIVLDYIHSKEILLRLSEIMDIQKPFLHGNADFISAFRSPGAPVEEFLEYWKTMVRTSLDSASRIVTVEVRAFTPDDALKIAKSIELLSERLVNGLSERARKDAVLSASQEVTRMENRLRRSSEAMRVFREKHQDIDPSQTAQANLQRLSTIQTQINEARARLVTQRSYMAKDAPPVLHTINQIKALEEQLKVERERLGTGVGGTPANASTLSGVVDDYQALLLEQEFAQKAYVSALSSLERARISADQQQRYLGTFVPPRRPQSAIYPRRAVSILVFVLLNIVVWGIGVLAVYAIRDHAIS